MPVKPEAGDALLSVEGLGKRYPNGVEAVRSVSLDERAV